MKCLFLFTSVLLLALTPQAPYCRVCTNGMAAGTYGYWSSPGLEPGTGKCIRVGLHCLWSCGKPVTATQYLPAGFCPKTDKAPPPSDDPHRAIFDLPGLGKVYLNFPHNLAPGDTVTGTVFVEPEAVADSQKNPNALHKFVANIGGQRLSLSEKTFRLTLPLSSPAPVSVKLLDGDGNLVESLEIAVLGQSQPPPPAVSLPTYGQSGRFVSVACPCDGVLAEGDYVKLNGQPSVPISESRSHRTFLNMNEVPGPTQIEFSEQGHVSKGEFRNISLKLSSDKPSLLKGEKATLHVKVSGLDGLKKDARLSLTNHSACVLTMSAGDAQTITIRPSDVKAGGTYTTERKLTGIRAGAFVIHGVVTVSPD